jgi:hypothetical protein
MRICHGHRGDRNAAVFINTNRANRLGAATAAPIPIPPPRQPLRDVEPTESEEAVPGDQKQYEQEAVAERYPHSHEALERHSPGLRENRNDGEGESGDQNAKVKAFCRVLHEPSSTGNHGNFLKESKMLIALVWVVLASGQPANHSFAL